MRNIASTAIAMLMFALSSRRGNRDLFPPGYQVNTTSTLPHSHPDEKTTVKAEVKRFSNTARGRDAEAIAMAEAKRARKNAKRKAEMKSNR